MPYHWITKIVSGGWIPEFDVGLRLRLEGLRLVWVVDIYSRPSVDYMMATSGCAALYQDSPAVRPLPQGVMGSTPIHSVWGPQGRLPQVSMLSRQIVPDGLPNSGDEQAILSMNRVHEHVLMGPSAIVEPVTEAMPLRGKPIELDHRLSQLKHPDGSDSHKVVAGNPIGLCPAPMNIVAARGGADSTASGNTIVASRVVESPTIQTGSVSNLRPRRQASQRQGSGMRGDGNAVGRRRSSKYRGVTKHRRSGRWEAHIWIKDIGRQVYLGGYEIEEHAAEAYDVAALKCKGRRVKTNFEITR